MPTGQSPACTPAAWAHPVFSSKVYSLNQGRFFRFKTKHKCIRAEELEVGRAGPLPPPELWLLSKIWTHPHTPVWQGSGELGVPLYPMPNSADWGTWKKGICPASGSQWITARFSQAKQLLWWHKAQPAREQHKNLQILPNWECQKQEAQNH